MAKIAPFAGLRYNQNVAGDLNKLVTQPYDKIDHALQKKYYERDPHNIVRIILSDESVADKETTYPGAAKTLQEWMRKGVLTEDRDPALYVYYQTFNFQGKTYTRKGFIASVALEEKEVRSHEHTMAGPKADRLRLLRALETTDENIFMLFSDQQNTAVNIMDSAINGQPPLMEATDDFGETHKVWAITDSETIRVLQTLVASRELFIADGHHRFETAINYKNECSAKGWQPLGNQGFDHRMMALFPMEDPGLVIFPNHRLVKNIENFNADKLVSALAKNFVVEPVHSVEELNRKMEGGKGQNVFGMAATGTSVSFYFLKLRNPQVMEAELPNVSAPSRRLDVTVLHKLILENELGIDKARLEAATNVEYARYTDEAIARLGKNGIQAVFFLNPTDVENVRDVASLGERMPQKSTDFYPKLLAGLVMMPLKIKK